MELARVKVVARASLPVRVCSKVPIWPCCVAVKDGHHMPIQFSAPLQAGLVRADFEHVSTSPLLFGVVYKPTKLFRRILGLRSIMRLISYKCVECKVECGGLGEIDFFLYVCS